MTQDQTKAAVRYVVAIVGGTLAGWGAKTGWVTQEQLLGMLNSETFIGLAGGLGALVWGIWARAPRQLLISTAQLPEVTSMTVKGARLVQSLKSHDDVQASDTIIRKADR